MPETTGSPTGTTAAPSRSLEGAASDTSAMDRQLAGLDALDLGSAHRRSLGARIWSSTWPKLAAIAFSLGVWQLVVLSGWKPEYVLPPPATVFKELWNLLSQGTYLRSEVLPTTLGRAVVGFSIAVVVGTAIGAVMSRMKPVRIAFASFVTGLQTMPSIVWFPMAIVLFGLNESAITFVVVIGAAPSVANGILSGADQIPIVLLRAGRVLGASGFTLWREVVMPASLPSFVAGLKQGWAFSWRSLMAGELIGASVGKPGIGGYLDNQRTLGDYPKLYATMLLILIVGLIVDNIFSATERFISRRRGLLETAW